jgi:hypothetical protein
MYLLHLIHDSHRHNQSTTPKNGLNMNETVVTESPKRILYYLVYQKPETERENGYKRTHTEQPTSAEIPSKES